MYFRSRKPWYYSNYSNITINHNKKTSEWNNMWFKNR